MANQELVFFDLPSKPPRKAWSYNPWRIRLALNFKGVPYRTEFIEYPDLKSKFQDHLPKADLYTIPTIILPDGTWVTDSWKIAAVLEEKYPEPSLHLDSPYLPKLRQFLMEAMEPLDGIYKPGVAFNVLGEASVGYFRSTREKACGMTLEQLAAEKGGAAAWKAAEPGLHKITALLKENSEGPFFEGKTPGLVDFVWAGFLIFMLRIGEGTFADALKATGDSDLHIKLLDAVKPWSERDDH